MSRIPMPFHAEDISALARVLKGELARLDHQPGHVDMLNMLARGIGYRNFQHFRAQAAAREKLSTPPPPPEPVDYVRLRRAARHFDPGGGMIRWPGKYTERVLCLWVLWSRLPPRQVFSERQISEKLNLEHGFGDPALLRRELVDGGWLTRTRDGSEYRRVERQPPTEAAEFIANLG